MTKSFVQPIVLVLCSALTLPGCFLAPTYKRPDTATPPAFKEAMMQTSSATVSGVSSSTTTAGVSPSTTTPGTLWRPATPHDSIPHGSWWEMFGDPTLNELEKQVVVSNQNIKQADAEYREAVAVVSQARANYFPTITTTPSVSRTLAPNISTRSSAANTGAGITNIFDLPVTGTWEPNIWGQITFLVRTAKAQAEASAAQLEGMRLSMQAQLAMDYFSLASTDMQIQILNDAIGSYQKFFQLTKARFSGGVASNADVSQAQSQLSSTEAQLTDLVITRAQLEHAIAVLVGQTPETFSLPPTRINSRPPVIPLALPSEILERRPDVAAAERQMVVGNQQIGIARAAYFPDLELSATGGFQSNHLSNWLSWPQRYWSLGASAATTLIDFGRRRAVSQQAQAGYDATIAAYRQTVLSAFEEVEDNLAALRLLVQEAQEVNTATQAAEKSLQLETELYKQGIVSYLDVITTQNIALTNDRNSAQIIGREMNSAVVLIRALGGGWDDTQLPWQDNLKSPAKPSQVPMSQLAPANQAVISVSSSTTTTFALPTIPVIGSTAAVTTPAVQTSSATPVTPSTTTAPTTP